VQATKYDVQDSLARISRAIGRPVDWIADNFATYYEAIDRHKLTAEALRGAAEDLADTWTEPRFPPLGVLLQRAKLWQAAHRIEPDVKSPYCSRCKATMGEGTNGRLAPLHEPTCVDFDPEVRPFVAAAEPTTWRKYLRGESGNAQHE
jgi:hypothetical protein